LGCNLCIFQDLGCNLCRSELGLVLKSILGEVFACFLMAIYMSSSNFKPCIDVYREGETLLSFSNGATCKWVLARTNPSLRFRAAELNIRKRRDLRFPTVAHNIRIWGGINFFRWKQKQNRQRDLQSILMRSLVFFATKQNFFIDFLVNNSSEYAKIVLEANSHGGQGGGFTLPCLGGKGDENYNGRKSSKKWWWLSLYYCCCGSGLIHWNIFRNSQNRLFFC